MQARSRNRWPVGTVALLLLVGCAAAPVPEVQSFDENSAAINVPVFAFRNGNAGRVVGTVSADATVLSSVGVSGLQGAKAQPFDPDGTPLGTPVTVDANGNFLLENLRPSRPRIFVEVSVKATDTSLRFRATMPAPRERKDYPVLLDSGSTYLADKLRRAALDHDVPLDRLDEVKVDQTEQVVNLYLKSDEGQEVIKVLKDVDPAIKSDLNAYAFDHFINDPDNLPVKKAIYALAPAILRGWKPTQPTPTPKASTSPSGSPTPTPQPTATPDPGVK